MGKGKRKRESKPPRPARIGPFGPDVRIQFSDHGDERFLQRLAAQGIDREALTALIRQPNGKKKDEHDPQEPKIRRWVLMEIEGVVRTVRVVFVVIREKTEADPGEIRVVTVIPEGA